MTIEYEIKAIKSDIWGSELKARSGVGPDEAEVQRQLEGIWSALLLVARKIDSLGETADGVK